VSSDAASSGIIAVLDTNALVRVMLAKSPLVRALRDSLERGAFILVTSAEILAELDRVLCYPRIFARHALTEAAIQEFEQSIRQIAACVPGLYAVSKIEADSSMTSSWPARWKALPTTSSAKIHTCAIRRSTRGSRSSGWNSSPRSWACAEPQLSRLRTRPSSTT
jgi:predicted nucleic acid-binding protein